MSNPKTRWYQSAVCFAFPQMNRTWSTALMGKVSLIFVSTGIIRNGRRQSEPTYGIGVVLVPYTRSRIKYETFNSVFSDTRLLLRLFAGTDLGEVVHSPWPWRRGLP